MHYILIKMYEGLFLPLCSADLSICFAARDSTPGESEVLETVAWQWQEQLGERGEWLRKKKLESRDKR